MPQGQPAYPGPATPGLGDRPHPQLAQKYRSRPHRASGGACPGLAEVLYDNASGEAEADNAVLDSGFLQRAGVGGESLARGCTQLRDSPRSSSPTSRQSRLFTGRVTDNNIC